MPIWPRQMELPATSDRFAAHTTNLFQRPSEPTKLGRNENARNSPGILVSEASCACYLSSVTSNLIGVLPTFFP